MRPELIIELTKKYPKCEDEIQELFCQVLELGIEVTDEAFEDRVKKTIKAASSQRLTDVHTFEKLEDPKVKTKSGVRKAAVLNQIYSYPAEEVQSDEDLAKHLQADEFVKEHLKGGVLTLDSIPPKIAALYARYFIEGQSAKELVAQQFGATEKAVWEAARRAKKLVEGKYPQLRRRNGKK